MSSFFTISWRIFLLGLQNFARNTWLSLAAISVISVALIFILGSFIIHTTSQNVITSLSENLKISVYVKNDANKQDISLLREGLLAHEVVADVNYIASEEAYQEFITSYGDDLDISEAISLTGKDIFPITLEVSVSDLNQIEAVGEIAQSEAYQDIVESVSLGKTDSEQTINRATATQNFLVRTNIVLAIIFASVACLIIYSTVRMAIFARREEIQIMRLIGASQSFIRNPFLVEAGLYGLVAGVIASGAIYGLLIFFQEKLTSVSELVKSYDYFVRDPKIIFLMIFSALACGVLIGILTSAVALQNYLRKT